MNAAMLLIVASLMLFALFVVFALLLWNEPWSGEIGQWEGVQYQISCSSKKRKYSRIRIGLDVPKHFRFEMHRESESDRFYKRRGLSIEHQFGDRKFDEAVYLSSNDNDLITLIGDHPEFRLAAHELLRENGRYGRVGLIKCANGRLFIDVQGDATGGDKEKQLMEECAFGLLPNLSSMARVLSSAPVSKLDLNKRDRFVLRSYILNSLNGSLLAAGVLLGFWVVRFDPAITMDMGQLWVMSGLSAFIVVMALLFVTWWLVGRSARFHLVLLTLQIAGIVGAISVCFVELRALNMAWDESKPVVYEVRVLEQTSKRSWNEASKHRLIISDWAKPGATLNLAVTQSEFFQAKVGQLLKIELHSGYFNVRWILLRFPKASTP